MVANIFSSRHTLNPGGGVKRFFFFESVHVAYQIKGNGAKNTMKEHILSLQTPLTPRLVSKGQIFFFSESGHVAYQIKWKEVQTNMHAKTLTLHTPLTSGVTFKGQILKLCR